MELHFIELNRRNINSFLDMAYSDVIERTGQRDTFTVAAMTSSGDLRMRAGIMQYRILGKAVEITWLYVLPEFRRSRVASELIRYLLKDAMTRGSNLIKAFLLSETMADVSAKEMAAFFLENGFQKQEDVPGPFCINAGELLLVEENTDEVKMEKAYSMVTPFEECTPDLIMQAIEELKMRNAPGIVHADKKNSYISESNGKYHGVLWSYYYGKTLTLGGICARDMSTEERLFTAFLYGIKRNVRFGDRIMINSDELTDELMEISLPELRRKSGILLTQKLPTG
jgi:ribosomal protein S18 acetylase RimI-like enzyme